MRRLAVVAALAAGLVLVLAAMLGCGSDCPTPEQAAYFRKAEDWTERYQETSRDLVSIANEGGSRPELILDEGWRRRLRRVLDDMNSANEEMIVVQPPSGTEEVHRLVVRVAEETIEVNEMLWRGVLDVDGQLIGRSNERRRESARLAEELLLAVERFCE